MRESSRPRPIELSLLSAGYRVVRSSRTMTPQRDRTRRSVGDQRNATFAAAFLARRGENSAARHRRLVDCGDAEAIACGAMLFGKLLGHSSHDAQSCWYP